MCCQGCKINTGHAGIQAMGYDFSRPGQTLVLPSILYEISGLAYLEGNSCACVQDEKGILFIYDLAKNEIKEEVAFAPDGDYEDITSIGEDFYVLRSDGTLYEISGYYSRDLKVTSYPTGIPAEENEGLCFDPDNNRLLIACKGKSVMDEGKNDLRLIFDFNLQTKTLSSKPVMSFNLESIRNFARINEIELPGKIKKNGEISKSILKFKTSAIALHPLTKKLYLLSAVDFMLFVFDMTGNIEAMIKLDPSLFNKAEGIAFSDKGDLFISNEGDGKDPTILKFNYSPPKPER
jgi:hypothetical protein